MSLLIHFSFPGATAVVTSLMPTGDAVVFAIATAGMLPWEWIIGVALVTWIGGIFFARRRRRSIERENEQLAGVLEERTRELETMNEGRARFFAILSHEIRTPMNGVIGIARELEATCEDPGRRENASTIRRSGEFLLQLVDDVLTYERMESGTVELERIPFDVRQLVEDCFFLVRDEAREKGLDLKRSIARDVPERLVGDPARLRQILINLISNAVKFTPSGYVEVAAELTGETPNTTRFTVRDTGVGIPEDAREQIFQPFLQAEVSTNRLYGGSGLGLAIIKQLVDLHGGTIEVKSAKNKGTAFMVTLPLGLEEIPGPSTKNTAVAVGDPRGRDSSSGQTVPASPRVLVVEDNSVNQRVCALFLRRGGYESETAWDGQEALGLVATGRFSAVLMDLRMPNMDGKETTRAIRSGRAGDDQSSIPIIGLTATTERDGRAEFLAAGVDACLSKPLSLEELLLVVRKTLEETERRNERCC